MKKSTRDKILAWADNLMNEENRVNQIAWQFDAEDILELHKILLTSEDEDEEDNPNVV